MKQHVNPKDIKEEFVEVDSNYSEGGWLEAIGVTVLALGVVIGAIWLFGGVN